MIPKSIVSVTAGRNNNITTELKREVNCLHLTKDPMNQDTSVDGS